MASSTSAPEALRTLRQRGSVVLGVVAMGSSLGFAILSLASGPASLVFVGLMLLVAAVGWVLLVRPSVVLTLRGVHLNNPLRRTHIPWAQVQDVAARWNLEVSAGGRTYPAWAVASHIERPSRQGLLGSGLLGRRSHLGAAPAPAPSRGATVGSAARLIEEAQREWSQLVAEGRPEVDAAGRVTREWNVADIACLVGPLVVAAVGWLLP